MIEKTKDSKPKGFIAISVAGNSDIEFVDQREGYLTKLVLQLLHIFYKEGGKLIYGGKLEKGGYTEMFKDISKQYANEMNENENVPFITNYLAWPYYNRMSDEDRNTYLQSPGFRLIKATPSEFVSEEQTVGIDSLDDVKARFLLATSMTAMRHQAEKNANARILVGGKTTGFSGCMPGIMEELLIALNYKHPVYLIGGFGGAASQITRIIEKKVGVSSNTLLENVMASSNYKPLWDYYREKGIAIDYTILDGLKIEDFDNGLTVEQNLQLFHSVDIEKIVSLVLLGLRAKSILS